MFIEGWMRSRSALVKALLVGSGLLLCANAWGDTGSSDATRRLAAEALYGEARELAAAGDERAACSKFIESQRLDPAPGTLMAIAQCHEREGKTATAWLEYRDVATVSRRDRRVERLRLAEAGLLRLEPKLRHVSIRLSAEAKQIAGLAVEWDGVKLEAASFDARIPVDPGPHVVAVAAPGRSTSSTTLQVADSDVLFDVLPPKELPAATPAKSLVPSRAPKPPIAPPITLAAVSADDRSIGRPIGVVSLAVGAGAVVTGGVFGVLAASSWAQVKDLCDPARCLDASARAPYDDARSYSTVSTLAITTGLVLVGLGLVLVVTTRTNPARGRVASGGGGGIQW